MFILDVAYVWYSHFAALAALAVWSNGAENHEKYPQWLTVCTIAWRLSGDIAALRTLIVNGHDVQAKVIVRSISENLDALALALIDGEFCQTFVEKQDPDESNQMWHKHLARGRGRKKLVGLIRQIIGSDADDEYRTQEEKILSASAHPSFISGWVSLFPRALEDGFGDAIGEQFRASPYSTRTLRFCTHRLLYHLGYDAAIYKGVEMLQGAHRTMRVLSGRSALNFLLEGRLVALLLEAYSIRYHEQYQIDRLGSRWVPEEMPIFRKVR